MTTHKVVTHSEWVAARAATSTSLAALAVTAKWPRVPEPLLVAAAAGIGLALRGA